MAATTEADALADALLGAASRDGAVRSFGRCPFPARALLPTSLLRGTVLCAVRAAPVASWAHRQRPSRLGRIVSAIAIATSRWIALSASTSPRRHRRRLLLNTFPHLDSLGSLSLSFFLSRVLHPHPLPRHPHSLLVIHLASSSSSIHLASISASSSTSPPAHVGGQRTHVLTGVVVVVSGAAQVVGRHHSASKRSSASQRWKHAGTTPSSAACCSRTARGRRPAPSPP